MIHVHLLGGAGNQLFGYAFGRSLSLLRNVPVFFDTSKDLGVTGYILDRYNVDIQFAQFPYANGPVYREQGMQYNPQVHEVPDGTAFVGYWQSSLYFDRVADIIRSELRTPRHLSDATRTTAECISKTNSVFIHVRRGDNLTEGAKSIHGNLAETDYYQRAIEYVRARVLNPTFFIFSDEPAWCEQNFRPEPSIVVTHNQPGQNEHEDMWLMTQCNHAIIANSSFSWWGAWLQNPTGIVVAPQRWFVTPDRDARDIVPERWRKL